MAITLNHTIVPAHDKEVSAKFFAHMFGLKYESAMGHFAPVRVNETLTLDFDNWNHFEMHRYAVHRNGVAPIGISRTALRGTLVSNKRASLSASQRRPSIISETQRKWMLCV